MHPLAKRRWGQWLKIKYDFGGLISNVEEGDANLQVKRLNSQGASIFFSKHADSAALLLPKTYLTKHTLVFFIKPVSLVQ